jgi:hypothetical protein
VWIRVHLVDRLAASGNLASWLFTVVDLEPVTTVMNNRSGDHHELTFEREYKGKVYRQLREQRGFNGAVRVLSQ